jgi:hypothetical protein
MLSVDLGAFYFRFPASYGTGGPFSPAACNALAFKR